MAANGIRGPDGPPHWNENNLNLSLKIQKRENMVLPATAIPAMYVYTKVVAVKTLEPYFGSLRRMSARSVLRWPRLRRAN